MSRFRRILMNEVFPKFLPHISHGSSESSSNYRRQHDHCSELKVTDPLNDQSQGLILFYCAELNSLYIMPASAIIIALYLLWFSNREVYASVCST